MMTIPKFYYCRITRHNANCFNENNEIILYIDLTQTKHKCHSYYKDILIIYVYYKDIHIKCILNLLKFHYQTARGPIQRNSKRVAKSTLSKSFY